MTAFDISSRNFTLSWLIPHNNNDPIIGYYIFYALPEFLGGTEVMLLVSEPIDEHDVNDLHPGTTYTFRMIAFNEEGNSSYSLSLVVRTLEEGISFFSKSIFTIVCVSSS